jgi:5-methyltetrahydrofolate--homocysteine methyltransferase
LAAGVNRSISTLSGPAVRKPFLQLARERVVVLDGAMGANLQTRTFDLQRDWLGHENISEVINLTRPEVIQEIHEAFLAVGCDGVETNTFGGMKLVLAEADLQDKCFEINHLAASLARRACDKFETPDRPRYVIGSVGPGTKLISLGHVSWDVMLDSYAEQMRGLLAGGADVLLIETMQDLLCIKCAINAARIAMKETGRQVPLMVQASFDLNNGANMLTGSDPETFVAAMSAFRDVDVLGLNCAFGPIELTEAIHYICNHWPRLVSCLPNAGLPIMVDGKSKFPMTPPDFVKGLMRFVNEFGVNIVGGCCGTMPEHLAELCAAVGIANQTSSLKPQASTSEVGGLRLEVGRAPTTRNPATKPQISSLVNAEDIRQDQSYLIIAERTNTNGSKKFRELLKVDDWDGLVSMARDEMKDGSHMLDVCVDFVGRDGVRDMDEVVRRFVNALPAPLMLDSTDPRVMEAGLKLAGGRCVLNSMNLEDGEEKLGHICALAVKYGAAVVAGCIDEDKENAMARTRERKLSIAQRIRDLSVDKFGLRDEDLMFDPLVLPISTGIEEDRKNALETIEGTRLISKHLPKCHTVVGLSNVSFGLKPAARIVLNSVFLHELREAGLTGAIVHASKLQPKNRIPKEQWDAALDLIYDRRREGFDPLTHFVSLFPDSGASTSVGTEKAHKYANLSIEETLKQHIIDGEKRDLTKHLDEALKVHPPLDIINNYLLDGMKVVGDLFGSGQMQLPFVLQSAETMKAAVAFLQPFMEKVEGQSKGKIVLATVKGDVHDIGKNLVDIILTNNGYTVYNLGIKQPIADILIATEKYKADAIGMSGLLVKSVAVMKENLEELNARGVHVPVLLGGAALTREYAEEDLANLYKAPLLYCKDAFDGLHVMDAINGRRLDNMVVEQKQRTEKRKTLKAMAVKPRDPTASDIPQISKDNPIPVPPFWGRRVVTDINPRHIFPFINTNALFLGQWGLKKGKLTDDEYEKLMTDTARPVFERLQRQALEQGFIQPKVVYGYFPVQSDGDELIVYHSEEFDCAKCGCGARHSNEIKPHQPPRERLRLKLPRQQGRRNLCITDFFRSRQSGQYDVLGVQLVTVGDAATELANQLREKHEYQEYLYLHGFGVESAEGLAEFWHKRMRQELGFSSEDDPAVGKLFQQKYRGSRYSFGYPACPNLEDRTFIVDLLQPEEIGVSLSENYMLVPEQSTDALVAHHPQAKYFDV